MEISPITQQNPAPAASSGATGALKAEADFETFLTLLTTQLNNQDPLKPVDSTEFVAQLAQFSAVEQQVRSNAVLERIETLLGGDAAGLADWLGREVLAPVGVTFNGEPVELRTTPDPAATSAELQVLDQAGSIVALVPFDPAADQVDWDGVRADGGAAAEGVYRFNVRRFAGDEPLPETTPLTYAEVREARLDADGAQRLLLAGGDEIPVSRIEGVR